MEPGKETLPLKEGGSPFRFGPPLLFFALTIVVCLPLLWWNDIPQRDVAARYAPMAEAFASGDFLYAFHPRTGFCHTVFAGSLAWLFSCDGFMAAKISSLIFMALGVFPLYGLARRIYSERVAVFSLFAYVLSSQVMRLAYSGLRDSCKVFFILLAAYGLIVIFQERKRLSGYLLLAAAAAGGVLTRGDLVVFMSALFFWGLVLEYALNRFPGRSLAGSLLAFALCLPSIFLHEWTVGAAVPEMRFAVLFEKAFGRLPLKMDTILLFAAGVLLFFLLAWVVRKFVDGKHAGKVATGALALVLLATGLRVFSKDFEAAGMFMDFLGGVVKGIFPAVAVFAIAGIVLRIRRRQWKKEDSILAALLIGHNVLLILQIFFFDKYLYVSVRYLLPAVPLELPWAVLGAMELRTFLLRKVSDPRARTAWTALLLAGVSFVFLADLARPVVDSYAKKKEIYDRMMLKKAAEMIRNDYRGPEKSAPPRQLVRYTGNAMPRICFLTWSPEAGTFVPDDGKITLAAYFAGGRTVESGTDAEYIVECRTECGTECRPLHGNYGKLGEIEFQKRKYSIWKPKNKP